MSFECKTQEPVTNWGSNSLTQLLKVISFGGLRPSSASPSKAVGLDGEGTEPGQRRRKVLAALREGAAGFMTLFAF